MKIRTLDTLGAFALAAYVGTVALANWLTVQYGFITVWPIPQLLAPAGTLAIGAVLVFRVLIQECFGSAMRGRLVMFAAIVAAAALSFAVSTPSLAVASGVTFLFSETADWLVYTPIRRKGWARAAVAGNVAGAVVDTILFLTLAHFPYSLIPGQLVGKLYATVVYLICGALIVRSVRVQRA